MIVEPAISNGSNRLYMPTFKAKIVMLIIGVIIELFYIVVAIPRMPDKNFAFIWSIIFLIVTPITIFWVVLSLIYLYQHK